jgi:hypothetical protein
MWLTLLGRFWYVPVIVALALYGEWWHHEAKDARNEFAVFKAQQQAVVAQHQAEDAKRDRDDVIFHQQQDSNHAHQVQALGSSLDAVVSRLRAVQAQGSSGSSAGTQPVRIAANVCDSTESNNRLSDALQDAERQFRSAVAGYQIGVAEQIIRPAAIQQIERNEMIEWALRGKAVNQSAGKP